MTKPRIRPDARLDLVRRLRADSDLKNDVLNEAISLIVPRRTVTTGELDAIPQWVEEIVDFVISTIAGDNLSEEGDLQFIREIGADRCRNGIPLEGLILSLEQGFDVGCAHVLTQVRAMPSLSDDDRWALFEDASARIRCSLLRITNAATEGFASERERSKAIKGREMHDVVERLLDGRWDDEAQALATAKAVGINVVGRPYLVLLTGTSVSAPSAICNETETFVRAMPHGVEAQPRSKPVPHAVALAFSVSGRQQGEASSIVTREAAKLGYYTIVTQPVDGLLGIRPAYQRARRQLLYLSACSRVPASIPPTKLAIFEILGFAPIELRVDYVTHVLGRVLADKSGSDLLQTLEALADRDESPTNVAAALGLHKNSLWSRRKRIEELTGRKFAVPAQWWELQVAIRLWRITEAFMRPSRSSSA